MAICGTLTSSRSSPLSNVAVAPWISDGTQHQWTVPAGEATPFKKGLVTRDVPDMPVSVTVEGELHADNSFEATKVVAKCPSKYEMQERQRNGEKMPHTVSQQQTM